MRRDREGDAAPGECWVCGKCGRVFDPAARRPPYCPCCQARGPAIASVSVDDEACLPHAVHYHVWLPRDRVLLARARRGRAFQCRTCGGVDAWRRSICHASLRAIVRTPSLELYEHAGRLVYGLPGGGRQ